MITGLIEDGLHPQIELKVFGAEKVATFTMLVDTGFDMDIGLHMAWADRLGLEIYNTAWVEYANGKGQFEPLCRGYVEWHGQKREIDILLSDDEEPALGTRLLSGCVMVMDFDENNLSITNKVKA